MDDALIMNSSEGLSRNSDVRILPGSCPESTWRVRPQQGPLYATVAILLGRIDLEAEMEGRASCTRACDA